MSRTLYKLQIAAVEFEQATSYAEVFSNISMNLIQKSNELGLKGFKVTEIKCADNRINPFEGVAFIYSLVGEKCDKTKNMETDIKFTQCQKEEL